MEKLISDPKKLKWSLWIEDYCTNSKIVHTQTFPCTLTSSRQRSVARQCTSQAHRFNRVDRWTKLTVLRPPLAGLYRRNLASVISFVKYLQDHKHIQLIFRVIITEISSYMFITYKTVIIDTCFVLFQTISIFDHFDYNPRHMMIFHVSSNCLRW